MPDKVNVHLDVNATELNNLLELNLYPYFCYFGSENLILEEISRHSQKSHIKEVFPIC